MLRSPTRGRDGSGALMAPMVLVRLRGGLGNQMFEYALGRHLSETYRLPLALELGLLGRSGATIRDYGLHVFRVSVPLVTIDEATRHHSALLTFVQYRRGFDPRVLDDFRATGLALDGYWQSERYFSGSAPIVREAFAFRPVQKQTQEVRLEACMRSTASVAVHVRRQDYVNSTSPLRFIGPQYYARAAEALLARVTQPQFYVFSDDIGWCEQSLALPGPATFVRGSDDEHFRLMTSCRHFIIANSTFSWWAAWLGATGTNLVIAPAQWFEDDEDASRDIVPERWLRV